MKISQQDVEHAARLARLTVIPEELNAITEQMDAILGYVDYLENLQAGVAGKKIGLPKEYFIDGPQAE